HVRVRRRAVEVKIILLDVLAMVCLAVGEAEQALFQNRIALFPQRQRKAQPLFVVADSSQPVLTPPVSSRTRLVMGEIVPSVAVVAVILPHRAPLPLAQGGSPFLPRNSRLARLVQPFLLGDINNGLHFFASCSRVFSR